MLFRCKKFYLDCSPFHEFLSHKFKITIFKSFEIMQTLDKYGPTNAIELVFISLITTNVALKVIQCLKSHIKSFYRVIFFFKSLFFMTDFLNNKDYVYSERLKKIQSFNVFGVQISLNKLSYLILSKKKTGFFQNTHKPHVLDVLPIEISCYHPLALQT